jgi:hypothetical protein
MLRLTIRRCLSDSPFRHGSRVGISKHMREKDFGRDVLLFAEPSKLRREAFSFINDPSEPKPKAFWEIMAKRANESIHLLDGTSLRAVMRALSLSSDSEDLLTGVCRVVCEDVENRGDRASPFSSFDDSLVIIETIVDRLDAIPPGVMDQFISVWADQSHNIVSPDDIRRVIRIIEQSSRSQSQSATALFLYKKLLYRWNRLSNKDAPIPDSVPFRLLLDTVRTS